MTGEEGLLRDPAEADLNALLSRARRAADLYAHLAEEAGAPLAALFRELAAVRGARADELEAEVRARGALPMDVDPDAETAEQAFARVRALLADLTGRGADAARARDRLRAEEDLAAALDAAASHDLPETTRAVLSRTRRDIDDARTRLARHAAPDDDGRGDGGADADGS